LRKINASDDGRQLVKQRGLREGKLQAEQQKGCKQAHHQEPDRVWQPQELVVDPGKHRGDSQEDGCDLKQRKHGNSVASVEASNPRGDCTIAKGEGKFDGVCPASARAFPIS
jgi:hypothetical protein